MRDIASSREIRASGKLVLSLPIEHGSSGAPREKDAKCFDRDRSEGLGRSAVSRVTGLRPPNPAPKETPMMTLCIRYTLDANKLADFEAYARALRQPIERCGGKNVAYYLPTKIAGPTNIALGLIDFPDLAAYQLYREKLLTDADGAECLRRAEAAGCILNEDRSFVRKASA
jgi:hypothetical protein